jgi:glycosyltransferase involved in cell wall biosynthesis
MDSSQNVHQPTSCGVTARTSDRARRVLLVAPQPFYEDRGTCIAVRLVAEALGLLGYGTDLLTYPIGRTVDLPGTRVLRASNPFALRHVSIGFSPAKLLLDAGLVAALAARVRRLRYTAIHAVEEAAFPAVVLGRRLGIPVLYDMQSSLPDQMRRHWLFRSVAAQQLLRRCERWLLERADLVVCSSGLAMRVREIAPGAHVREWRFPSQPGGVSPDAVRDLRRALRIPDGARVALYSGTFEPYQGLAELVSALPTVVRRVPGAVLVLVGGNGATGAALSRQAATLGVGGSLRLVERQPRESVPGYLALADVLVSPRSYGENAPLKVFDYLAAGKPIVASNLACHSSVLGEDRAVLVPHTPDDLAHALTAVLEDPSLAARLGAGALRFAEEHLEPARFVRTLARSYDEVIARFHGVRAAE